MESDNLRRDIKPYEGLTKVYRVYNKDRTWLHKKDDSERFVGELNKELAQSKGIDVNELSVFECLSISFNIGTIVSLFRE